MRAQSVYFIKPTDAAGPIKIGTTNNITIRMQGFSRYSPVRLEVAAIVTGSLALERSLHERFAYAHSHYEWFYPVAPLLRGIELLKNGAGIEEAFDLSIKTGSIRKNQPGVMARFTPQYRQRLSYLHAFTKKKQKLWKEQKRSFDLSDLASRVLHQNCSQVPLTALEIEALNAELARLTAELTRGAA